MIWKSQKEKLSNKVLEASGNMKQLYNLVSNLTSTQQLNPLPEDTPSGRTCGQICRLFHWENQNHIRLLSQLSNILSNIKIYGQFL